MKITFSEISILYAGFYRKNIRRYGKAQAKKKLGTISNSPDLIFCMKGKQQLYRACCKEMSLSCALAAESLGAGLSPVCTYAAYSLAVTNPPSVGLCPLQTPSQAWSQESQRKPGSTLLAIC